MNPKHRALIFGMFSGLFTLGVAAEKCWIDPVVYRYYNGYRDPDFVSLDPMMVDVPLRTGYSGDSNGERFGVIETAASAAIQAAMVRFGNSKLQEINARFNYQPDDPLKPSSAADCYRSRADVENKRVRFPRPEYRAMAISGDWTGPLTKTAVVPPSSPAGLPNSQSSSTQPSRPETPKDALAMANFERLRLERSEPDSLAARRAGVEYRDRLISGIQSGAMPDLKVTQDDISKARAEWQQAKKEFPTSDHTKSLGKDLDYLVKIKNDQDKTRNSASAGAGPMLTRESREPKAEVGERSSKQVQAQIDREAQKRNVELTAGKVDTFEGSSGKQTIICFKGTVPAPNQRCGTNKSSKAPAGNGVSR